MHQHPPRLGIDIGRVIIDGASHPSGDDTAFFTGSITNALRTPAVPGTLDVLPRLVRRFGGRAWLVSKCGERVQERTRRWLEHHRLLERTGIPADHVRFCRQRPEKAGICAQLGITHFIDDRRDVHQALRGLVPHLYLFGPQPARPPGWLHHVTTWAEAEAAVLADLPRDGIAAADD